MGGQSVEKRRPVEGNGVERLQGDSWNVNKEEWALSFHAEVCVTEARLDHCGPLSKQKERVAASARECGLELQCEILKLL